MFFVDDIVLVDESRDVVNTEESEGFKISRIMI